MEGWNDGPKDAWLHEENIAGEWMSERISDWVSQSVRQQIIVGLNKCSFTHTYKYTYSHALTHFSLRKKGWGSLNMYELVCCVCVCVRACVFVLACICVWVLIYYIIESEKITLKFELTC